RQALNFGRVPFPASLNEKSRYAAPGAFNGPSSAEGGPRPLGLRFAPVPVGTRQRRPSRPLTRKAVSHPCDGISLGSAERELSFLAECHRFGDTPPEGAGKRGVSKEGGTPKREA